MPIPSPRTTILASLLAYPVLFKLTLSKALPQSGSKHERDNAVRLAASREAVSAFHCGLMTILTLTCLKGELTDDVLYPHAYSEQVNVDKDGLGEPVERNETVMVKDSSLPIITRRSEFANCLTALELGYLVADVFILAYVQHQSHAYQQQHYSAPAKSEPRLNPNHKFKGLNYTHLYTHHFILISLLSTLHLYISRCRDRGILIIAAMLLMNASSPFGTARWFLVNFHPHTRRALRVATLAYLLVFGLCRVGLPYVILKVFGGMRGMTVGEVWKELRVPCKLGIGGFGAVNALWFINGVCRFLGREMRLFGILKGKAD